MAQRQVEALSSEQLAYAQELFKELREARNITDYPEVAHALRTVGRDPRRIKSLMGQCADLIEELTK